MSRRRFFTTLRVVVAVGGLVVAGAALGSLASDPSRERAAPSTLVGAASAALVVGTASPPPPVRHDLSEFPPAAMPAAGPVRVAGDPRDSEDAIERGTQAVASAEAELSALARELEGAGATEALDVVAQHRAELAIFGQDLAARNEP